MKSSAKKNMFYIIVSIILSMIVHFCFLALFMQIHFSPNLLKVPQRKPNRHFKLLNMKRPLEKLNISKKKSEAKAKIQKIDLPSNIPDTVDVPNTVNAESDKNNSNKYDLPKADDVPSPPQDPKLTEIVTVDGDSLPGERAKFNRLLIPKLPRTTGTTDFAMSSGTGGTNKESAAPAIPVDMRLTLPPKKQTPDGSQLPTTPETRLIPEEKVEIMDPFLDVKLYKFPLPDGGGFFRIDLSPNAKAAALQTFRKDVIFLLDVSGSIGRIRLEELKTGLFRTLETLKPDDRFNIIGFRSGNIPLFVEPMHPSKENIKQADKFLFKMRHSGSTNIYSALELYTGKHQRAAARPLILFLLSDGKVNYGEIINNSGVINAISNRNHEGAAIYSFSCGRRKNSFLMDLISYRNRGESLDIKITDNSNIALSRFIYNVADVKVTDLEYQVSSNLADYTFPKRLPNLHKGKILSVYGRYPKGTDKIGLRITGLDSKGIRREIVFGGNLANAALAGSDLPEKWASQYIYHLYSLITVKYDDSLKNTILQTAKKFNLELPYLDAHLKPRKKKFIK